MINIKKHLMYVALSAFAVGLASTSACAEAVSKEDSKVALEKIFGASLLNAEGKKVPVSDLAGKKVGIYFSAQWCPPCRAFTPSLVEAYNKLKEDGKPFEIVFVSSDRTQADMYKYMKDYKMNWLAVPFDADVKGTLPRKYGVRGIPMFVVIGPDGKTITTDGRGHISSRGAGAFERW